MTLTQLAARAEAGDDVRGLRLAYVAHWLRFKTTQLFRPYWSRTPAASTCKWGLTVHRWGFVLFTPGKPRVRCGTRRHVSWRFWAEGPRGRATLQHLPCSPRSAGRMMEVVMPERSVRWHCKKCRRTHWSYDEARACERDHIVDDAVTDLRAELSRIFSRKDQPHAKP